MTAFPILYKFNSTGGVEQWQIFVEGDTYYTESGQRDGKLTRTKGTICVPKNVGKSNETTGEQQAMSEAASKFRKKLDNHYNEVLTTVRSFYEPMLAHGLEDNWKLVDFSVPTYIQPKYDGVRAISQAGVLTSRGGKTWIMCPHLHQTGVIVDGELYNHKYHDNFNEISRLFKRDKSTPETLARTAELGEMWVYDMPSIDGVFSARYAALTAWVNTQPNPMYKLVPTQRINSREELEYWHERYLQQGYEGSIIRLDGLPYEQKRSKQLLKYKSWKEDEFKIIGFEEGVGERAGKVGAVVIEVDPGVVSNAGLIGSHDYAETIWNNQTDYIGKRATVKYQNLTPDGKLRIAHVKDIGREDFETL